MFAKLANVFQQPARVDIWTHVTGACIFFRVGDSSAPYHLESWPCQPLANARRIAPAIASDDNGNLLKAKFLEAPAIAEMFARPAAATCCRRRSTYQCRLDRTRNLWLHAAAILPKHPASLNLRVLLARGAFYH